MICRLNAPAPLDASSINKSGYAAHCRHGLAMAAKHLGTLAERGLLLQISGEPSTAYVLPGALTDDRIASIRLR